MNGLSIVDGFMEVNECLVEMIKYLANEPSVGLFYVQQHTQNAVSTLINLKDKIVEKSHETTLHTENLEDSITMMRSMKGCGFIIADEMVRDIKSSLFMMSTVEQQRGCNHTPGYGMDKSSPRGPVALGQNVVSVQQDVQSSGGYLSSVLKSAKEKAVSLRWPQIDFKQSRQTKGCKLQPAHHTAPLPVVVSSMSTQLDIGDELPLSSQNVDEQLGEAVPLLEGSQSNDLLSILENYDDFKAARESKLEEWLERNESLNGCG